MSLLQHRASTPWWRFQQLSDTFRWVYPRIFRTHERFALSPHVHLFDTCAGTLDRDEIINEEMIYRFDVDKFHSKLLIEVTLVSRF